MLGLSTRPTYADVRICRRHRPVADFYLSPKGSTACATLPTSGAVGRE
jgi:hypothetical protein